MHKCGSVPRNEVGMAVLIVLFEQIITKCTFPKLVYNSNINSWQALITTLTS